MNTFDVEQNDLRRLPRDPVAREATPDHRPVPANEPMVATLVSLQRSAGNAAVAHLLHESRLPAPVCADAPRASTASPVVVQRNWLTNWWRERNRKAAIRNAASGLAAPQQNQARFRQAQSQAVQEAAQLLAKVPRTPFHTVLAHLAQRRREIAEINADPAAAQFGRKRAAPTNYAAVTGAHGSERMVPAHALAGTPRTNLTTNAGADVYAGEMGRVTATHQALAPAGDTADFHVDSGGARRAYQVRAARGDGTSIPLTTTVEAAPGDTPHYVHTSAQYIDELLNMAGTVHGQLLVATNQHERDQEVQKLGEITWLVTNAMPYERGSASIAEWYNLAVIQAMNLQLAPRQGKLDLAAFRHDKQAYVNGYRDVYEQPPH